MPTVSADRLRSWTQRVLEAAGVADRHAALIADSLVAASLRGVDSHGIHLLASYLDQIGAADVAVAEMGEIVTRSGACMVYDGRNGLGQVIAEICTGHATRLAREFGIGIVTARESNHFGAAGYWALRIASVNQIGLVFCNASPIVAPWQGKEGRFGTNPICMAVPAGKRNQWMLDMATTTVAANRIFKAHTNREPAIPAGWAMDKDGAPTTNTEAAYGGLLMPLGGYKGSGLAMMVEILCGALSGGAMSTELGGLRIRGKRFRASQTFIAIDAMRMQPQFAERVDWLVERVKDTLPATGFDEVLVANEPELRTEQRRLAEGIPIPEGTYASLIAAAGRAGVTDAL
ncbi:MAG TPA: Ldh family oxidoreductase [Bryobacteraceae bacterium]|nr:Ldh family oxidoreductase [Bryobacteraceae bacterium]